MKLLVTTSTLIFVLLGLPASSSQVAESREGAISHIANLPSGPGSDIEFAQRTLILLDETGNPVCQPAPEGGCLTDANGNVVYIMQDRAFAFLGRLNQPIWVVDITDPREPRKVAEIPCRLNQSDLQVSGNVLVMAADAAGSCAKNGGNIPVLGFATADITDPRNPRVLGRAQVPQGAHNVTVHPTQPFVYVSNGDLLGPSQFHIFDISDPANPVKVRDWQTGHPQDPPHDLTFNAAGTRAYCACGSHTEILDTTDPRNPVRLALIPNPENSYAHQADPTPDGNYLLVSDELGGGASPMPSPGGGVHVYDIRDETTPLKVGTFWSDGTPLTGASADHVSTAHVFRINPDGYSMAIAWYKDGVHVVDFSDIRGIAAAGSGSATGVGVRTIAAMKMPNADTWAAKMWQERLPGYVFANDINRGLDVFYVPLLDRPGPRERFLGTGTIRIAHTLSYTSDANLTMTEFTEDCRYTPRSNGADAWVTKMPPGAGGTHDLVARARTSLVGYDLDVYYLDSSCALIGADEDEGTSEEGPIPEGAAYALVAAYATTPLPTDWGAPANIALTLSTRPIQAPE